MHHVNVYFCGFNDLQQNASTCPRFMKPLSKSMKTPNTAVITRCVSTYRVCDLVLCAFRRLHADINPDNMELVIKHRITNIFGANTAIFFSLFSARRVEYAGHTGE
jgi:hypothetical protein